MSNERYFRAIYNGDCKTLKKWLEINPELKDSMEPGNVICWQGTHVATVLGYFSVLNLLILFGSDVHGRDSYGWAATHHAVIQNQLSCLQILLQSGASVDALTSQHESLVFLAVFYNRPKILRYLVNKGADICVKSKSNYSPSHKAVFFGHLECLRIILNTDYGSSKRFHSEKKHLIMVALNENQIGAIHILLSSGSIEFYEMSFDDPSYKITPHMHNYLHLFQLLNSRDAKKDQEIILKNTQSLEYCINSGDLELTLSAISLLMKILKDSTQEIIKQSIAAGLKCLYEQFGFSQIMTTCFSLCPEEIISIVNYLVSLKHILFNNFNNDISIFNLAIVNDQAELLNILLNYYGHDNVTKDMYKFGETPIHSAVRHGSILVLEYLIKQKYFQIDIKNKNGESLVHYAIRYSRDDVLYQLIHTYHANVDSVDGDNNTPLHLAVQYGNIASIHMLFNAGFYDINLVNNIGETPLTLAQKRDDSTILSLLSSIAQENDIDKPVYDTLVFQGGGVKGIAFYGAMLKLIETGTIDLSYVQRVAGTSAGAITALLLAIDYDLNELGAILNGMNFFELLETSGRDEFFSIYEILSRPDGFQELLGNQLYLIFLSLKNGDDIPGFSYLLSAFTSQLSLGIANRLSQMLGLHDNEFQKIMENIEGLKKRLQPFIDRVKNQGGFFDGEVLRKKFVGWIADKGLNAHLTFCELHELVRSNPRFKDLYVAAYDAYEKRTILFSYETTPDVIIADAVRCSMSIQLFFAPHKKFILQDGKRIEALDSHDYYDGGSLDNYILEVFDRKKYLFPLNSQAWLKQHGDEVITNVKSIGFRLLSPEMYKYYEEGMGLPKLSTQSHMDFLIRLLSSLSTFTNQENQYMLHPDQMQRTIHINTHDIDTVDFKITQEKKQLLIKSGLEAGESFYKKRVSNNVNNIQGPSFLKYYFPFNSEKSSFLIPHDPDVRLSKILKMAQSVSAQSLTKALRALSLDFFERDKFGNTLFHLAVRFGDVSLLSKLWSIDPVLEIKNNQGMTPLDCIIYCNPLKLRENILEFFIQNNIWHSSILSSAERTFSTTEDKCDYLLCYAHKKNSNESSQYLFSFERYEQDFIMLQQLAKQENINWGLYSNDAVMNYCYLLIKKEAVDLLNKLQIPINQGNRDGITALHMFVLQNNKICVEQCISKPILAHYNVEDKNGETPLDKVFKIQSFSTKDTQQQQRLMIYTLFEHGAFRCSQKSKLAIIEILAGFSELKSDCDLLIKKFNAYDQETDGRNEYRKFKDDRNAILINERYLEKQKLTDNNNPAFGAPEKHRIKKPLHESHVSPISQPDNSQNKFQRGMEQMQQRITGDKDKFFKPK